MHNLTPMSDLLKTEFLVTISVRGFTNIFRSRATGFHRQAKVFELNFSISETFLKMIKSSGQSHPHNQLICLECLALNETFYINTISITQVTSDENKVKYQFAVYVMRIVW